MPLDNLRKKIKTEALKYEVIGISVGVMLSSLPL